MSTATASPPVTQAIEGHFRRTGQHLLQSVRFMGGIAVLTWQCIREASSRPFYFRLIVEQLYFIGVRSFFLVFVTGMAVGSVMSYQFGFGLAKFGGKLYVPKLVGLSILREMGPVFTSLLVAGRIGSGMASEISSMKVTQQIDAIRALGTSPIKRIVIPRVVASLIALPLLTLFADAIGLVGSMLVSMNDLAINPEYFYFKLIETLRLYDLWTGMLKTVVFAFFISIVACWKGLNSEGGTEGVGNTTTQVVVLSSVFIMISDVFMTKIFFLAVYPRY